MTYTNHSRFSDVFKLSELQALNTAHSNECAVLVLSPAAYAVLGFLVEMVVWPSFITDDVSGEYDDLAAREFRQEIYNQMAYIIDLNETLERMVVAQERTADAIEAIAAANYIDDGGEQISGAEVLAELSSNMNGLYNFFSGDNPFNEDERIRQLVNALQLTSAGGGDCCEPDPTVRGMVNLPPQCVDFADYNSAGSSVSVEPNPDGSLSFTTFSGGQAESILTYGEIEGEQIIKFDIALLNNDSGEVFLEYKNDSQEWVRFAQWGIGTSTAVETVDANSPFQLKIIMSGQGDQYILSGGICPKILGGSSKPVVILDTKNGIGEIESGGFIQSGGAWVTNQFNPAVIKAAIDQSVENVQIDWTRTFDGTVVAETYDNGSLVNSYEFDASLQRQTVLGFLSSEWDELKIEIRTTAAQTLADIVVWAFAP